MKKLVLFAMIALLAQSASALDLWDRSDFDAMGMGFFNSESGAPPMGITHYAVNHVVVGGSGWVIESVSNYYSNLDPAWGYGILEGRLHIYAKTGPLPINGTDDPTVDVIVPMSATMEADHWKVTATGLSINLMPGEYWIGITPNAPGGMWGPEIHLASFTSTGDATASYDPYGMPVAWFNFVPGVDAAILIEGDLSTPTNDSTFSSIKALY